jgi:TolA-binding protein
MKRTERRHLKENELAHLAATATEALAENRQTLTWTLAGIAAVAVVVLGYLFMTGRSQSQAQSLLAEATAIEQARVGPPPAPGTPAVGLTFPTAKEKNEAALAKFKAVADQYPSTDAGLFARYRQGTTLMALGNPKDAVAAYQQVVDKGGDGLYAQMARLGIADAQERLGQFDQAINTFKELAQHKDGPLPIDGVLIRLGRTYLQAGKPADAQQTFNRLISEFPDSPFTGDAQRELEQLKKS